MVERQPVDSCNLKTVGYDTHLKNLEIEFHSGMVFQYQNVPSHIFANLLSAQSTGTFFTDNIKNRYRSKRLDKATVQWLSGRNRQERPFIFWTHFFFNFCAFISRKQVLSISGIWSLKPVRVSLVSQLFEVPYFLHQRALFHNLWYVPNFQETQNSHDWWYLIQTGLAMTNEKNSKKRLG